MILWFIQTFFPTMRCRERVSCRLQRLGNLRSLIWCPGSWGTCLSHHPASLAHSQALIVAAMYHSMVPWLAPLKPLILRVWEQCCFEKLLYLLWRLITILHPLYNNILPWFFPWFFPWFSHTWQSFWCKSPPRHAMPSSCGSMALYRGKTGGKTGGSDSANLRAERVGTQQIGY